MAEQSVPPTLHMQVERATRSLQYSHQCPGIKIRIFHLWLVLYSKWWGGGGAFAIYRGHLGWSCLLTLFPVDRREHPFCWKWLCFLKYSGWSSNNLYVGLQHCGIFRSMEWHAVACHLSLHSTACQSALAFKPISSSNEVSHDWS